MFPQDPTRRHNFIVNLLDGTFFGAAMGFVSYTTTLPLFVDHLTDSALLLALVPALRTLGWQLPQLLTAPLVARRRRYLPIVLWMTLHERLPLLVMALIAGAAMRLSPTMALTLLFMVLTWLAFGGGLSATAWQSMIGKIVPDRRRGTFFGFHSAMAAMGGMGGAALAGRLMDRLPYPTHFVAIFLIAALLMAVSFFFLAATREEEHELSPAMAAMGGREYLRQLPRIVRHDHNFLWYLLSRWMIQLGFIGLAFYSVYAVSHHGVSAGTVGLYTSLLMGAHMLTTPLSGWGGDRWGFRFVIVAGALALGLAALVAWATPSAGGFALVFLLSGIANGCYWSAGVAMPFEFAPTMEARPAYVGLANTLTGPAALLIPLVGGWIADRAGYPAAFLLSAAGALATALIVLFFVREPRRVSLSAAPALQAALAGEG